MHTGTVQIVCCPEQFRSQAFQLVLRDLPPWQRESIASTTEQTDGLWVAIDGDHLLGASWAQRQPGNTAVCWPPQLTSPNASLAGELLSAVTSYLDEAGFGMTQVLAGSRREPVVAQLKRHGFCWLADLVYLAWDQATGHVPEKVDGNLVFETYQPGEKQRLQAVIAETYRDTLDCPRLGSIRSIDDVLAGYESTGEFNPDNWYIVRSGNGDIGTLLLSEHPSTLHGELIYMGVVSSARGRGWGTSLVRYAQRWLLDQDLDRLVLAVDAANEPAMAIYRAEGFRAWDQRTVMVRAPGGHPLGEYAAI